ncbi:MAG: PQQ-dependent dehydrogenase, methanol/ethanol family [Gemmatimonadota bacterium]
MRPCRRGPALPLLLLTAGLLAACGPDEPPGAVPERGAAPAAGTIGTASAAEDGQWTMQAKDYAGTRYSGLDQINVGNVARLRQAWSFSTGQLNGHEGAPLVVGSTMFLVTPFPNVSYALDLTQPEPTIKWQYNPRPNEYAIGKACCDVVNRGWAYADGKLIYNLLDAHTIAIDAETGREVWRTKMDDVEKGVTMTMAPLVVKDRVLVGNSGGEMGVYGWIAALDVKTGREVWRAHNTGPDELVRIGPEYRGPYPWLQGEDLGVKTWPGDAWRRAGSAVWGWITYDPELDLIYYGTSNPSPWNQEQRPGLNLFSAAVLARDPDDGMARWAYSFTPHDAWDYDGVNEDVLVDLPIGGRMRKVLVHFNRNGFAYVLDRTTGRVLSAEPFGPVNWATGVDLETGLPQVVPEKVTRENEWVRDICPADVGYKNHSPTAYSPRTGLFYVPRQNVCMDYRAHPVSYIEGTPYWGAEVTHQPGPGGFRGEFMAWNPVTGTKVWGIPDKFPVYSGVLATGGDLVFYGTVEGYFRAVDARTGRVLWQDKLPSGIIGAPMTYRGPDGRQYVAILSGVGGTMPLYKDVPGYPPKGGSLHVFSLGDGP